MEYMSAKEAADNWGISKRRVQVLCAEKRIKGASKIGMVWVIPKEANKPIDERRKSVTIIGSL
jgi:hypothetical protein